MLKEKKSSPADGVNFPIQHIPNHIQGGTKFDLPKRWLALPRNNETKLETLPEVSHFSCEIDFGFFGCALDTFAKKILLFLRRATPASFHSAVLCSRKVKIASAKRRKPTNPHIYMKICMKIERQKSTPHTHIPKLNFGPSPPSPKQHHLPRERKIATKRT